MSTYSIRTYQKLPISLNQAWEFISSPYNLETITPPDMKFDITNSILKTDKMYAGQVICYKLTPLLNISMEWVTEITHVKDKEYFIDEQRFGPYAFWHHQHFLKPIEGGIIMEDIVHYKLPFGFLGKIAHFIFVKQKLKGIFDYRYHKMEELFGKI
jgi:ligand-binding SRPBCC domain-containing protein